MSIGKVNGTTLYYEEVGQGPPCLVVGAPGMDHTCFRGLDPMASRLRLIYYDHRCSGRSGRPPLDTITMEQLADDAAALITDLSTGPVIALGQSYGGFVVQELAIRHPNLVRGVVLMSTTAGQRDTSDSPHDDQGPPPRQEWVTGVTALSTTTDNDAFAAGFRELLPHYVHRSDPALLSDVAGHFGRMQFHAAAVNHSMRVLGGWSSVDRLPAIQAPTLVAVGRHDRVTSPAQARRIARRIPHAQLVEFEHSAHFPWLEEPQRFSEMLNAWLDATLPSAKL